MLARIITKIVGWAVAIFFDVERMGPRLAAGPVLVVANHPNALVDPLVIFRTAGRPTQPLAKAPLFEQALAGMVLKGLGGLPVYRRQDDPSLMHLNDRTFDAAIGALTRGGAVQIFPEGRSHSEPSLTPIRTGAARIALMAEDRVGWSLGLNVQPVGLTYERKAFFRGRVIAVFGSPIPVADYRDSYEATPKEAVRHLTDVIRQALEEHTLNFDSAEDRELVEVAERLYARGKGLARSRERVPMVDRMPRLQRFAAALKWLGTENPERLEELRHSVSRYLHLLTIFGATDGDVPKRYRTSRVVRYALRQLFMLACVLPVAAIGAVVWVAPFLFTRHVVPLFRPKLDQLATYKVSVAFVAFPVWLGLMVGALWLLVGWRLAVGAMVALPAAGFATIAWRDRQAIVQEDLRVFLRARRRSESRDRLAELRATLVADFDALSRRYSKRRGSP